ncbi:hypothetical protein JCM10207_004103 [Rhodosporidiobolus poonsookiae]
MKVTSLLASLALCGTFALATAIPRDSLPVDDLALDKRAPAPKPEPVPEPLFKGVEEEAALDKRGEHDDKGGGGGGDDVRIKINIRVRQGRPGRNYRPDGSGRGYGMDWRGHGRPNWCPDDWHYFGRDVGWAPYRGWRPNRRWEPNDVVIKIIIRIRWWSPPNYWRQYWYSRWKCGWYKYDIPDWWDWHPRRKPWWCRSSN